MEVTGPIYGLFAGPAGKTAGHRRPTHAITSVPSGGVRTGRNKAGRVAVTSLEPGRNGTMQATDERTNTLRHAEAEMVLPGRTVSPIRRLGAADSASWAGTALPLTACVAIWGIGDAAPAGVAWLTIAHGVIGTVASVWTVLQLAARWWAPRVSRPAVASWPKPRLLAIYALLVLQPMLAIASSMLHGGHTTLFGILLPSVLPVSQHAALQVDRLHGGNAIALPGPDRAAYRGRVRPWRQRSTQGLGIGSCLQSRWAATKRDGWLMLSGRAGEVCGYVEWRGVCIPRTQIASSHK